MDVIHKEKESRNYSYEPSCFCSFKMADATEASWPHGQYCSYYLYKRNLK
jgi:hypothetical protein